MDFDIDKLVSKNWKQGSFLTATEIKENKAHFHNDLLNDLKKDDIFFLPEYSCAIVAPLLEKEPYIRCIRGRPSKLSKKGKLEEKHFCLAKNSRYLSIQLSISGELIWYKFSFNDCQIFPREVFQHITPSTAIEWLEDEFLTVIEWITLRVSRSAFPGHFEDRLKPAKKALESIMKEDGDLFAGPYIKIEPNEEITADDIYEIDLMLVSSEKTIADNKEELTSVCEKIESAIKDNCAGIEISSCEYKSKGIIFVAELEQYNRMTYEYLSEAVGYEGEKPPELN